MKTIDQILLENLNKQKNSVATPGTSAGKANRAMTATEIMMNKLKYQKEKFKKKAQFKEEVQNYLMETAIGVVFNKIMEDQKADAEDYAIGHNVIKNFVQEEGYTNLIRRFTYKNLIVSEMARHCEMYTDLIVETAEKVGKVNKKNDEDICYMMDSDLAERFVNDIKDLVPQRTINIINRRVANSVQDFLAQNTANKLAIKDIYAKAEEKAQKLKDKSDAVKEAYINEAKIKTNQVYRKPTNMLGAMVASFSEAVMKDPELRSQYLDENNHINMESIVNANVVMYTVLEELNTMQMVDVSPEYIKHMLKEI
jgi:hypothetical protein